MPGPRANGLFGWEACSLAAPTRDARPSVSRVSPMMPAGKQGCSQFLTYQRDRFYASQRLTPNPTSFAAKANPELAAAKKEKNDNKREGRSARLLPCTPSNSSSRCCRCTNPQANPQAPAGCRGFRQRQVVCLISFRSSRATRKARGRRRAGFPELLSPSVSGPPSASLRAVPSPLARHVLVCL